jgi:OmpA-OmpF porin, OOP family
MGTNYTCAGACAAGLKGAAVVALLVGFAGSAVAQTIKLPEKYIAYGGNYLSPGDRPVDYGIGFDLSYGQLVSSGLWLEGTVFTAIQESGVATAPDFYQSGLGLNVLKSFGSEARGHFYALGGLGLAMNDVTPDDDDGASYYGQVGGGYRGALWEEWGLRPRVELRYVYDTIGEGTGDIVLAFKMEIPPKRQTVVEKIVEREKIVEVPVEIEKIVEKETICVVPPQPVCGPTEAPADDDRDGVMNSIDKCPGTLAGAKVDGEGCVKEEQKISLPNIEFESGKVVLATGGKDKLESVVTFLQNQKEVQVDVFGHTDSQGADTLNQKLSDGRAKAIVEYLVSRGIAADRLTSKGFGETQPIASNETKEGRAQNRRVELLLRMTGTVDRRTPVTDSDNDGVADALDKCANTLGGARAVDNTGCVAEEQTIALKNVAFDSGATLSADGQQKLEAVATFLLTQTNVQADVVAYARRAPGVDQQLAEDRAKAVRAFLISKGVGGDRLRAKGVGGSREDRLELQVYPQ